MPFAATWMSLEIIILTEMPDKEKYNIAYMWNLNKIIQMNLFTNKFTDLENKLMVTKGEM